MKSDQTINLLELKAGQFWTTEKNDLQIVRVGRLVAQYRFVRNQKNKKKSSIQVEQVSVIQNYLSNNGGILA